MHQDIQKVNFFYLSILLKQEDRVQFQKDLSTKFCSNEKKYSALKESETEPSLLLILQRWLENWPWKKINYEQFMNSYKAGVENFLNQKVSVKVGIVS